jgi:hypothetical protein
MRRLGGTPGNRAAFDLTMGRQPIPAGSLHPHSTPRELRQRATLIPTCEEDSFSRGTG